MFYDDNFEVVAIEKFLEGNFSEGNEKLNVTDFNKRLLDHSITEKTIRLSQVYLNTDMEKPEGDKAGVDFDVLNASDLLGKLSSIMDSFSSDKIGAVIRIESGYPRLVTRHLPRYEVAGGSLNLMILLNAEITMVRPPADTYYIRAYVPKFLWDNRYKSIYRSKFYIVNSPGKIVLWDEDFYKAFPAVV